MKQAETYYSSTQVSTMRSMSWKWGLLLGFWLGVSFMAISDVADFHICVGQCDDVGLTLWGDPR